MKPIVKTKEDRIRASFTSWTLAIEEKLNGTSPSIQSIDEMARMYGLGIEADEHFEEVSQWFNWDRICEHIDSLADKRPRILNPGNVIERDGRKRVMRKGRAMAENETFVSDEPHENNDFSYTCGSDWCRCMQ